MVSIMSGYISRLPVRRARRRSASALVAVVVATLAAAGCGVPRQAGDPAAGLQPGWNALGDAPWSQDVSNQISFWTGAELVVAGGYNHKAQSSVSFASSTYAYSLETMQWRELAPLSVPGYDGVLGAVGAWVGSAWFGLAYPCRSGPTPDEAASEACDASPVGLRWTVEKGWTVALGAATIAAVGETISGVNVMGVSGGTLMLSAIGGMLTIDTSTSDSGVLGFTAWPAGIGKVFPHAACLVDGQVLALTADASPETEGQGTGTPPNISVTVLAPEGLAANSAQTLGAREEEPITQCLAGRALLFQPTSGEIGAPIQRITPTGATPWAAHTAGEGAISVGYSVDVGTGLFFGRTPNSDYTDQMTGEVTPLAAVPYLDLSLWTGNVLMAVTSASHQLVAFLPEPSWEKSGDYAFPEPVTPAR